MSICQGVPLPTETEASKSMFDACNKEWSAPELLPAAPKDFKEHPDRDLTNYPYPSRPMYPPKTRLLMMPDSWFTAFQKVTGTSGPYLFFGGLFAFLVNKELKPYIFPDKIDAGLYKDYQDRVGFFKGLIQEDLKEAVEFRKTSAQQTESLNALKESLPTSFKESMQLQLEAADRKKNIQNISGEIKRRIDRLEETEGAKARFERDQLLKLINESVEKQVSQKDFQEKFLQNAIQQLKGIAV
ncbi:hypothetical protein B9Z55_010030 [Caenorhabditis nigoni]|uniref:ATP synthase subunit b n=1 Tax=Caenorhabditis nigoni TaxID=1611254 RepID=A0A2G5UE60_9PELO|nr:hypothetical protein B9Z55_010030 [Caenorhabditis nigoni]